MDKEQVSKDKRMKEEHLSYDQFLTEDEISIPMCLNNAITMFK
jgi:hypothetical protein